MRINNSNNNIRSKISSPGNWAYCYAELAFSFLAVVETIASSRCAYPQAELAWWLVTGVKVRQNATERPSRAQK